jgi:GNAT superfamily N-acetyltransferase
LSKNFTIRRMQPDDSPALLTLEDKTVDTGRVGITNRYHFDYFQIQQFLRPGFTGIVAESPEFEGLIGVALLSFGECQVEGEILPYCYLGGLGVHQDFRRRGISTAITSEMMSIVRKRFGNECIVIAGIQGGNEGSLKANMKWANQVFTDRSSAAIGIVPKKPPSNADRFTIRLVKNSEIEEVIKLQNNFYRDVNLYPPKRAADLEAWLAKDPFGPQINRYYVAVDQNGHMLAGLGVSLTGTLMTSEISRIPLLLRGLNAVLHVFPKDGAKTLNGHWFWFLDGEQIAGSKLWDTVKWLERQQANMGMLFFDVDGPVRKAISLPRFLPQSSGYIVVNTPRKLKEQHFLYFNNLLT